MNQQTFDRDRVATLYIAALELEIPIVATVADVLKVSADRARYMVRTVRQEGFLGQAPHYPARAMIHRGSYNEKIWIVCQECTTRWPCAPAFPHRPLGSRRTHEPRARSRRNNGAVAEQRPGTDH